MKYLIFLLPGFIIVQGKAQTFEATVSTGNSLNHYTIDSKEWRQRQQLRCNHHILISGG